MAVLCSLASVVAEELYASPLPLLSLAESDFAQLKTDDEIQIIANGKVIRRR